MRIFWVLFVGLFVTACGTPAQALTSPCQGKPPTGALGQCPPCSVDTDCKILTNACEPTAYCVHRDSNFMVNTTTCDDSKKYPPTPFLCKCLANVCDWHH